MGQIHYTINPPRRFTGGEDFPREMTVPSYLTVHRAGPQRSSASCLRSDPGAGLPGHASGGCSRCSCTSVAEEVVLAGNAVAVGIDDLGDFGIEIHEVLRIIEGIEE